jgi:thiol:disulfide interchange protein DsbC
MIIFRFIVLFFSLQSFVLDKDEIKAKLNEIIPDKISVDTVEDTYSSNFFSVALSDGSLFYVTADGEFIINGDLYQIEKNSLINFSDMRDSKKRITRILEINPSEFITFEPKEKKTDHLCVYRCRLWVL